MSQPQHCWHLGLNNSLLQKGKDGFTITTAECLKVSLASVHYMSGGLIVLWQYKCFRTLPHVPWRAKWPSDHLCRVFLWPIALNALFFSWGLLDGNLHETRGPPVLQLYHTMIPSLLKKIVSFLMAGNCLSVVSSKDSCLGQTSGNLVNVCFFAHFFSSIHSKSICKGPYQVLY